VREVAGAPEGRQRARSGAPSGLRDRLSAVPQAFGLGYILAPLRGAATGPDLVARVSVS